MSTTTAQLGPQPQWLAPTAVGLIVLFGLVAAVVDGRPDSQAHGAPWEVRLAAVAVIVALSQATVMWSRIPSVVFVAAVALPAAWLNIVRDAAVSFVFVAMLVAWVAFTGSLRASLVALGLGLVATAVSYLVNTDPEGWLGYSVAMSVIWLAMRSLVRQQALVVELRAAQAGLARQAEAAERRRIAREIHDVAAHTLAVTMLQLTGVRMLLQRSGGDPRAIEALAEAERLGRQGLDDVRRTVGLLGEQSASPEAVAALPGAADIQRLVEDYRQAGQEVDLTARGDLGLLTPAAGLALYRIVQEALANVARHAPGARARVDLDVGDHTARLRIVSSGGRPDLRAPRAAGGSGLGLLGMRERAMLLGGTLEAGREDDGWRVECSVPLRQNHDVLPPAAPDQGVMHAR